MSDDADFSVDATPSLQQLIEYFADTVFDVTKLGRLEVLIANAVQKGNTVVHGAQAKGADDYFTKIGEAGSDAQEKAKTFLAWGLAHMVAHLLGVEVPPDALQRGARDGADSVVGRALGETFLGALRIESGELQPGDHGAVRLLGILSQFALNSWFEGTILEEAFSWVPMIGHAEAIGQLGQQLISATGLDELGRMAFRPLANVTVMTPMQWQANKTYRPNLLSEGEIIKAFQRGDYDGGEAAEEFARLGYSDRRQDLLIKSATKRLSLDDAMTLVREGSLDRDYALQNLKDEGYDDSTAQYAVVAAETRRYRSIVDDSLAAITSAYVNRDLSDGEFSTFLPAIIPDADERGVHETTARHRRDLNIKHLSHSEVIDCIELLILPTAYYRGWLAREGYRDEDATALELRLLARLTKEADLEAARKRIEREKADEKARRAQEKLDRLAAIEEERRLHARGSISDLTRAVVRGLIPIDRLVEVLRPQYDDETVGILVILAETDRAAYVGNQEAAKQARQRAANRSIDVGAIEQAVLNNVLTIDEFRARLVQLGFTAGDVGILSNTLVARKKDADDARAKRAQAEAAAAKKSIDLGRAEQLIIRGHHTLSEYDALLSSLGFEPGARAAMSELLQLKIDDYAAASQARADAAAKDRAKSVSVEQMRRAVVLNVRTVADYQNLLVKEHFTADAQATLLAAVRADADEAAAARARRQAADARGGAPRVSLDRLARAARLGIVTPAAYRARLVKDGYSSDDMAIEMDLLTVEIADAVAQRARRDELEQRAQDRGLSLSDVARAVKAGAVSIEAYRARAAELHYSPDDVALLVAVLDDELAAQADAEARHATIDGELAARTLSLGQLEESVGANLRTLAQYQAQLEQWGYAASDAQLLTSLLATKLAAQRAKGTGG